MKLKVVADGTQIDGRIFHVYTEDGQLLDVTSDHLINVEVYLEHIPPRAKIEIYTHDVRIELPYVEGSLEPRSLEES